MKLAKALPELSERLELALMEIGETALAEDVKELELVGRCNCDDETCGTFYTFDKQLWFGKKLRQVIPAIQNLYAIDVMENQIVCIEILDDCEVSNKLTEIFG